MPSVLDELGGRQWGLLTRAQALQWLTAGQLRNQREAANLVPVYRGVYRFAGVPRTWRQRALAACLAYGAPVALSHRAAARLWGFEGVVAAQPEVTVPRGRSGRIAGVVTHRAMLPDPDVTASFHIPVTTARRTLVDLAGVLPAYLLERSLDQARRMRLLSVEDLASLVDAQSGSGRSGHATMRGLADTRLHRPGTAGSAWEDQLWSWVVAGGLEPPDRQVQVIVAGRVRILDLAYPQRKIAIEFAGFAWHGQRHRFDSDAARSSELQLAGWLVVTVTSSHTREEVVDRVRRALALRPGNRARDDLPLGIEGIPAS